MRRRDSAGLALAPLFLRLVLALTFIWAGLGKFMAREEVSGDQAAILANYGEIPNPRAPRGPMPPAPDRVPITPEDPAPGGPADGDTDVPPVDDEPVRSARAESGSSIITASWQEESTPSDTGNARADIPRSPPVLATANDFPEPVLVPRRAMLVLGLHSAIHPGLRADDSSRKMALWPDLDPSTDYDPWPVRMAWAVALTEVIAGILVGIGLLTRISALSLAGVMLGAMWLTEIGPAVQEGTTRLGFLPDYDTFDGNAWKALLWQFALFCTAMALFFGGPGTLSLDRLLMGGPSREATAKPKGPPPQKK